MFLSTPCERTQNVAGHRPWTGVGGLAKDPRTVCYAMFPSWSRTFIQVHSPCMAIEPELGPEPGPEPSCNPIRQPKKYPYLLLSSKTPRPGTQAVCERRGDIETYPRTRPDPLSRTLSPSGQRGGVSMSLCLPGLLALTQVPLRAILAPSQYILQVSHA